MGKYLSLLPSVFCHAYLLEIQIALDSQGTISKAEALAMASSNIQKLLGVEKESANSDLVATWGGDLLSFEAKVVGVLSKRRGKVDLF